MEFNNSELALKFLSLEVDNFVYKLYDLSFVE